MSNIEDQSVAVIIVNYGTPEMCSRALDSLNQERNNLPLLRCVVVDNDSPDDSYKLVSQHIKTSGYDNWAEIIEAGKNGGYAFGNNLGIKYFQTLKVPQPDFYWLLNPDTYLRDNAGKALINFILDKQCFCIAGSRLEDSDGTPQVSTFNFPTWRSEILSGFSLGFLDKLFSNVRVTREIVKTPEKVDWVAGASLMIPKNIFNEVGLMDDEYFLYFEEVDYCLSIFRAGYSCWYVPESRVVHEVGASTGISDIREKQPRRPKYWFNSRNRFFRKNYGITRVILADLGWTIGYSTWCFRKFFSDKSDLSRQPPKMLRDMIKNSVLNPFS